MSWCDNAWLSTCVYWTTLPGLVSASVAESWPLFVVMIPAAWMIGVSPPKLGSIEPRARRLIIVLLAALTIDACVVWGTMILARYGVKAARYLVGGTP